MGAVRRPLVIGGGVAGLIAAWELAIAGQRPVLLERSRWLGGPVARHTVAGIELDAGAESFAIGRPAVAALLVDLGLGDRIVPPAPLSAWLRHEGGSVALPKGALLGIPGDPLAADVIAAIGTAAAQQAVELDGAPVGLLPDSLGALVLLRMGEAVLRRLVDPVVGGVHAADPNELETDAVAPGLRAALTLTGSLAGAVRMLRGDAAPGSAVAGIEGGMAELPRELADQICARGGEIRRGATVLAVTPGTARPAAFTIVVGGMDGREQQLHTDTVVIACPADDLLDLTARGGPRTPGPRTTPVTLQTLVMDDPRLDVAPRGTGVLVSRTVEGIDAKALTHATAKWPWLARRLPAGRHVLRLSYGRGDGATIPELPGVLADAADLLDVDLRPGDIVASATVRWPSALPQARPGHRAEVAALRSGLPSGMSIVGGALAGNGLSAIVDDTRTQIGSLTTAG